MIHVVQKKEFWPTGFKLNDLLDNFYTSSVFKKCMAPKIDAILPTGNVVMLQLFMC